MAPGRVAALAIATVVMSGCIAVSPDRGQVAPQPGELPFELAGPGGAALIVPVRLNDAGPFPFVLDTGATVTCVDEALATKLELPEARGAIAFGGGVGGVGRMRLLTLDSVAVGDAVVRGLQGCALDLGSMKQAGLDVQGLLGLNFLRSYRLTIDFASKIIRLDQPAKIVGSNAPNTGHQ